MPVLSNMQILSAVLAMLLMVTTASCQVLSLSGLRQETTPFHTRLNVQNQQVPAFVITSIDHRWKEQSMRSADPKEKKIPVLIASNPGYGRAHYQHENQHETTAKPAANTDYDVTEDEANDPRFQFLYDALSKQYVAKYEASAAANSTASSSAPVEQTTPAPTTTTTTEATTTTTAPVTREAISSTTPAPKEELLQSYPSYQSVSSVPSKNENYEPAARPTLAYPPMRAHRPSKYVPSDVFTIEQSTNYRPRQFHSDSIFYQKALAFLRDYKEVVVNNRQHGLTYRPNSETDDPSHVANAYDELTPVLVKDREIPLVPRQLMRPAHPIERHHRQLVPYDEHSADDDRQLVGFLPVIALPKNRNSGNRPYTLLSQLTEQESVHSVKSASKPLTTPRLREAAQVEASPSMRSVSIVRPQQYEHHVPFLRVINKHHPS